MESALILNRAIVANNINLVKSLIASSKNVVNEDVDGFTALHVASCQKSEEITKILLQNGADLTKKTNGGLTALHYAATEFIVQTLIDHGAEVHNLDDEGCTPLHLVCEGEDLKTIKCLLKNGANLKALDLRGHTPLIHAIRRPEAYGYERPARVYREIQFILEHSDVNVIDKRGENILNTNKCANKASLFLVVKHIAKLKFINYFIHPRILDTIAKDQRLNFYFTECTDELLKAKTMKFSNSWVSYFNFLVDGKKRLAKYAGNLNIIKDFETRAEKIVSTFPAYGQEMRDNFDKAIKNRKIWDKAAIILSNKLPIFDRFHLIIRNILDSSSIKDLSILIE